MIPAALAAASVGTPSQPVSDAASETIVNIQVHGNPVTPAEEIVRLSGLRVGVVVTDDLLAAAAERIRDTGDFRQVEVLKRFASIADPTQIAVVILVDEGPIRIAAGQVGEPARLVRQSGLGLMFLPVLGAEDGYGISYGVRLALPDLAGRDSRVSIPVTWGGDRRVAVELEKTFEAGPVDRVLVGAGLQQREHPFFEEPVRQRRVWGRGERSLHSWVRVGGEVAWQRLSFSSLAPDEQGSRMLRGFDGEDVSAPSVAADIVVDTRINPAMPRNAVYARARVERLALEPQGVTMVSFDAAAYVGLVGPTVLAVHAVRSRSSGRLPVFFKPILGGTATLRGFRTGVAIGDELAAASLELRRALTSPLSGGQLGVSAFVDNGVAYADGLRLRKQRFDTGIGGSVWLSGGFFRLELAVARGIGSSTRAHLSGGFLF